MNIKGEKLLNAIGQISDDKILIAEGKAPAVIKPLKWQFTGLIAAALILAVGTVVMLYSLSPENPNQHGASLSSESFVKTPGDSPNTSLITGNEPIIELSEEREAEILRAYARFLNADRSWLSSVKANDLYLSNYHGTYNGFDVVTVWKKDWVMNAVMNYIEIEGYLVAALPSGSLDVMVYTGNTFVEIREAYEQGFLKYEDLRAMTFQRLRRSYAMQLYWESVNYNYGNEINQSKLAEILDDVIVLNYYGYYNYYGQEIVTMWRKSQPMDYLIKEFEIAGYKFTLSSTSLNLQVAGYFNDLADEYEWGSIPKSLIAELYQKHFNPDYVIPDELNPIPKPEVFIIHEDFELRQVQDGLEIAGYTGEGGDITIPDYVNGVGVVGIDHNVFWGKPITGVKIPDTITYIGSSAFQQTQITELVIPASVTYVYSFAFTMNDKLTSVTIPASVLQDTRKENNNYSGYGMFSGCVNLTDVVIEQGARVIEACMFEGCTNLSEIVIPDSVYKIGDLAFNATKVRTAAVTNVTTVTTAPEVTTAVTTAPTVMTAPEPLSAEMSHKVMADWLRHLNAGNLTLPNGQMRGGWWALAECTLDDFKIGEYFGTYNGNVVFIMNIVDFLKISTTQSAWGEIIAGYRFRFNSGNTIAVWNNGDFYSLAEAYDKGLLTQSNIEEIRIRYFANSGYDINDIDFFFDE